MNILDFFVSGYFESLLKEFSVKRYFWIQNIFTFLCVLMNLYLCKYVYPFNNQLFNSVVLLSVGLLCAGIVSYTTLVQIEKENRLKFLNRIFPLEVVRIYRTPVFDKVFSRIFFKNKMAWLYFVWFFVFCITYDIHNGWNNRLSTGVFLFLSWLTSSSWNIVSHFVILHVFYFFSHKYRS